MLKICRKQMVSVFVYSFILLFNNYFLLKVWDLRANNTFMKLRGHTDTITGLSLSSDGSYLSSNSMDNTLRIWEARPYAPQPRCVTILSGHKHNFEKY